MLSGIRTIYFSTDLTYPPLPNFEIKTNQVLDLYNKLREPGGYPYENLELQASPPTLSTRREGGLSRCQIGNGRIRIEEDSPAIAGMGAEEFAGVVKSVLGGLGQWGGPFFAQRCVVRCTAQPMVQEDSLELLAGKLADALHTIEPFGRPPSFFGVRFRFSPHRDEPASAGDPEPAETVPVEAAGRAKKRAKKVDPIEHRGYLTLRYETYSKDIKQVWMEVEANYVEQVIDISNVALIKKNILDACQFVTENAKKFLDQFDVKDDA
jgi:hypothetical protein